MAPIEKLGVIAGGGKLPVSLADAARAKGIDVHVFVLGGQGSRDDFLEFPCDEIRIGAIAESIAAVRGAGIHDVVFAGSVRRPSLVEIRPDAAAAKLAARGVFGLGDDGLLRAIVSYLEEQEGFRIHSVDEVMPGLRPKAGILGRHAVPQSAEANIEKGRAVLRALSHEDIGQSVVVQDQVVLGIEAAEGTDALIERCGKMAKQGGGPVLLKLSKIQQSERVDLPAVGPETIHRAAAAGFAGIVVEADRSLVLERDETVALADKAGLFLVAVPGIGE